MKKDQSRSRSRSRESGGFSDHAAADLRAKAAAIAAGAWQMAGFELTEDTEPEKPLADQPDEPA